MNVLLTGGAGYIGSHIAIELLSENHNVIILDNYCNSSPGTIEKIKNISHKKVTAYQCDITDFENTCKIFEHENIDCVIHLAGLKAVGESVEKPLDYFHNNLTGAISLLNAMKKYNCKNIIFSSSATVYGTPKTVPVYEDAPRSCTNPYGRTKLIIEEMLEDLYSSDTDWNIIILRYFNPVGAHESGLIGEMPSNRPNNIMPTITKTALGKIPKMSIFGDDYDTPDGTCIRDYIHVVDLAKGHVKAIDKIYSSNHGSLDYYNLGTGTGYSVKEIINTFMEVNNIDVPHDIKGRRSGDVDCVYANPDKAIKELKWKAHYSLEDMCRHAFEWEKNNNQ